MSEAATCCDFGDARIVYAAQQLSARAVKPQVAQKSQRRLVEKSVKVLLQRARRDPAQRRQFANPPRARRLSLEPLDRLLQSARKQFTAHGALRPDHKSIEAQSGGRFGREVDSRGPLRIAVPAAALQVP